MLQILIPIDESSNLAALQVLTEERINSLVEKTISAKRPMISFSKTSIFNSEMILITSMKILKLLMTKTCESNGLEKLYKLLDQGEISVEKALNAIFHEDSEWFKSIGTKFSIEPSLALYIFDSPLRPYFEELARRVEEKLLENWWESYCPVCGRQPSVARMVGLKRFMICTYCGAKYLVDLFTCTFCGNNEPNSMGFLKIKRENEYELNYCEKCKNYIKVINSEGMRKNIPVGLEDILTQDLDFINVDCLKF
jgi:FdhE protein